MLFLLLICLMALTITLKIKATRARQPHRLLRTTRVRVGQQLFVLADAPPPRRTRRRPVDVDDSLDFGFRSLALDDETCLPSQLSNFTGTGLIDLIPSVTGNYMIDFAGVAIDPIGCPL